MHLVDPQHSCTKDTRSLSTLTGNISFIAKGKGPVYAAKILNTPTSPINTK